MYPIFTTICLITINLIYFSYLLYSRPYTDKIFLISEIITEALIICEIIGVLILAI